MYVYINKEKYNIMGNLSIWTKKKIICTYILIKKIQYNGNLSIGNSVTLK